MNSSRDRKGQRGVAIVMAMGVLTLTVLASAAILATQSTWMRRGEIANDHVQAQLVIQAGLDWARAVLSDDRLVSVADHEGEPWALQLPAIPVEDGTLLGRLEDQQARFNLNNLSSDGRVSVLHIAQFRRLLALLELPEELAGALADWLDVDNEPQPGGGAEDAWYLSLPSPYLAANRPLLDVSELALVKGFDAQVRARLRPFVTALPRPTPVNANTAPPQVLAAVIEDLTLEGAGRLVAQRRLAWFRNFEDFARLLDAGDDGVSTGLSVSSEHISVGSDYFIATAQVNIGLAQARGQALLARGPSGWPTLAWRKNF